MLDAAASLFAERGVDRVSLRQIAAAADVNAALIRRYIGNRDELVRAVFDDLSRQLAETFLASPLSGSGFGLDTVGGKWARLVAALVVTGRPLELGSSVQPGRGTRGHDRGELRTGRQGGAPAGGTDRRCGGGLANPRGVPGQGGEHRGRAA